MKRMRYRYLSWQRYQKRSSVIPTSLYIYSWSGLLKWHIVEVNKEHTLFWGRLQRFGFCLLLPPKVMFTFQCFTDYTRTGFILSYWLLWNIKKSQLAPFISSRWSFFKIKKQHNMYSKVKKTIDKVSKNRYVSWNKIEK